MPEKDPRQESGCKPLAASVLPILFGIGLLCSGVHTFSDHPDKTTLGEFPDFAILQIIGAAMMVYGIISLARYLKSTPLDTDLWDKPEE